MKARKEKSNDRRESYFGKRKAKSKALWISPFSFLFPLSSLFIISCAPQTQPTASTPSAPILIEGGVVEGRQVRAFGLNVTLPSAPLSVARSGQALLVAYPFQLLIYRNDLVQETVQLPGIPKAVKAKPLPLVLFEDRLFVPGQGSFAFKATDAINTRQGIYWLDDRGANLERRRVLEGEFKLLEANSQFVYAFGREGARLNDGLRFPLPRPALAAVVLSDVYVLTAEGIVRLSENGLQIGSVAGKFSGLQSDGQRLYSLRDGRLVTISLDLRLVEIAGGGWRVAGGKNPTPPLTFGAVSTSHIAGPRSSPPDARGRLIDSPLQRSSVSQGGARTAAALNLPPLGNSLIDSKLHSSVDRNHQGGTQGAGEGLEPTRTPKLDGGVAFDFSPSPSSFLFSLSSPFGFSHLQGASQ